MFRRLLNLSDLVYYLKVQLRKTFTCKVHCKYERAIGGGGAFV